MESFVELKIFVTSVSSVMYEGLRLAMKPSISGRRFFRSSATHALPAVGARYGPCLAYSPLWSTSAELLASRFVITDINTQVNQVGIRQRPLLNAALDSFVLRSFSAVRKDVDWRHSRYLGAHGRQHPDGAGASLLPRQQRKR